jgi:hypothetical protein
MLRKLKFLPNTHSGKIKHHEHTSYLPLFILLVVALAPLSIYTVSADSPPPAYQSIGLQGTMPGIAPEIAATIDTPTNSQRFASSPIEVSGSCPKTTLVEVFKNDIFAGSTICTDSGTYAVSIDLLSGANTLIARVYDAANQAGPDSNIVTIFYDSLPSQSSPLSPLSFGSQLLIRTDAVFRGVFPGQEMLVPIEIIGGTIPYAVNVQWGDTTNSVLSRNNNQPFSAGHVYSKAGTYQMSIQVTDGNGNVAFLTVAVIVNGQPNIVSSTTISTTGANILIVIWPLYVGIVAVVISFWLGEVREKRVLKKRGLLLPT